MCFKKTPLVAEWRTNLGEWCVSTEAGRLVLGAFLCYPGHSGDEKRVGFGGRINRTYWSG